jgi:hypothetical protein
MTRIERMKEQRQLHCFWAWRESLDTEKPIKSVAVAVQFFMSFVPFLSFLFSF